MSQTAKVQEPSMEEILASIRRIIADDDANKVGKSAADKPAEPVAASVAAAPAAPVPPPRPMPAAAAPAPPPRPAPPPAREFPPVAKAAPPPPPVVPPAPKFDDVLDLPEAMAVEPAPMPASAAFRHIEGDADILISDQPLELPAEPAMRAPDDARRAAMPDRAIISSTTAAAVDNAFNSLAHTVLGNNARTLEDLVKEMLRPMLKAWLDDNLPGLVDRIVRAEIERVSRGR